MPGSAQPYNTNPNNAQSGGVTDSAKILAPGQTGYVAPAPPYIDLTQANPSNLTGLNPQQLTKSLGTLTESQVTNPSTDLINALAQSIGNLSPADAANVEKSLTGTLGSDVQAKMSDPSGQPAAANPYGFDPLSFGQFFADTLGPFLQSVNSQAAGQVSGYSDQMAKALAGASPQLKAAYAQSMPGMQEAQTLENQSQAGLAFSSPMFDTLIQNLQSATTGAKAAQTQAAEAPYITQAITGVSSPGNAAGQAESAANLAAIYQQALQNLATNSGASGALPGLSGTAPATAASQSSNPLAAYLPAMAAPAP